MTRWAPVVMTIQCRSLRFTAAVTRESDLYVAQCLEIGIASQGSSPEESVANLQEALGLRLDTAITDRSG